MRIVSQVVVYELVHHPDTTHPSESWDEWRRDFSFILNDDDLFSVLKQQLISQNPGGVLAPHDIKSKFEHVFTFTYDRPEIPENIAKDAWGRMMIKIANATKHRTKIFGCEVRRCLENNGELFVLTPA
jgi:hypothetical protein